jgi:hypothetical protein
MPLQINSTDTAHPITLPMSAVTAELCGTGLPARLAMGLNFVPL